MFDGFDQSENRIHLFLKTEEGGVEFNGVVGLAERVCGSGGIESIPMGQVVADIFRFRSLSHGFQLGQTPFRACGEIGREVDLQVGMRKNRRSEIAPLADEITGRDELAHRRIHDGASLGDSGHHTHLGGGFRKAQLVGHIRAIHEHLERIALVLGREPDRIQAVKERREIVSQLLEDDRHRPVEGT